MNVARLLGHPCDRPPPPHAADACGDVPAVICDEFHCKSRLSGPDSADPGVIQYCFTPGRSALQTLNCCSQRTSCAPRAARRRQPQNPKTRHAWAFGSNTVCRSAGPTEMRSCIQKSWTNVFKKGKFCDPRCLGSQLLQNADFSSYLFQMWLSLLNIMPDVAFAPTLVEIQRSSYAIRGFQQLTFPNVTLLHSTQAMRPIAAFCLTETVLLAITTAAVHVGCVAGR
eukprot:COSAG01_NODE_124_length_25180_cov_12.776112_4_plen_226_part_00